MSGARIIQGLREAVRWARIGYHLGSGGHFTFPRTRDEDEVAIQLQKPRRWMAMPDGAIVEVTIPTEEQLQKQRESYVRAEQDWPKTEVLLPSDPAELDKKILEGLQTKTKTVSEVRSKIGLDQREPRWHAGDRCGCGATLRAEGAGPPLCQDCKRPC